MANPIYGQNKADAAIGAFVTTPVSTIASGVAVYVTAPINGYLEGATWNATTASTTATAQCTITDNDGNSVATYAADGAGIPVTAINKGAIVAKGLSDNDNAECIKGDTFVFTFGSQAGAGIGEMTVQFVPSKSV
jgi:sensor histidine kinase regulating citrate/malate metabolism